MFDIKTTITILSLITITATFIIFFAYLSYGRMAGVREWAIGFALISLGGFVSLDRDLFPFFVNIVIGNSLSVIGCMVLLWGVQKYLKIKPHYLYGLSFIGLYVLAFLYLYDDDQQTILRIHIFNFSHGIFFVIGFYYLVRSFLKRRSAAVAITAFGFFLEAVALYGRSVLVVGYDVFFTDAAKGGLVVTGFHLGIVLSHFIITVGFLLLISQNLRESLKASLEEERKAREEQENFWAMVSHEFKTPLSTVKNNAILIDDFFKTQKNQEVAQEGVKRIERAAGRLSGLIDQSLVNQWANATSDKLHKDQLRLLDLVEELAFEYDVTLKTSGEGVEKAHILGDVTLFSTALSSLVDNAQKYGQEVTACELRVALNSDNTVQIDVFNTGTPIAKNDADHLFDKFYRADNHPNVSGSGLGLYITKKIVDLHGGTLRYLYDNGVIFRITVPISV